VQRGLNEAEARLVNRRNKFLEDARLELAKAEDDIAQSGQTLTLRKQEQQDSVFSAMVPGIVKNIRVTTVGGVLRPGEELMQIIPVDDDLMIEAKVSTADIARVIPGLEATVRFDTFDYTIFGGVKGEVAFVSADSLKEETNRGMDIYYRVRVKPASYPVTSTTGMVLDVLPGMTVQVDIRTGERTVMDYLLKPLRKTLSESFGER
jgi:adhesin transport system membrane fusion protein